MKQEKALETLERFITQADQAGMDSAEICGHLYGIAYELITKRHGKRKALQWSMKMSETAIEIERAGVEVEEMMQGMRRH